MAVYGNKKNERKAEIIVEALIHGGITLDEDEKKIKIIKMLRFSEIGPFNSGLAPIKRKGKWGFINKLGGFHILCQYDWVELSSDECLIVAKKNEKWGYIDTDNNVIIDFVFDEALPFLDGFAIVKQGRNYGVIGTDGTMIIQPVYHIIKQSSSHLFSVKKNNKWGVIDTLGNIILPFIYDNMTEFSAGVSYVRIDKKHGFVNLQGEFVLELTNQQRVYPINLYNNFELTINFEFIAVLNLKGKREYDWSIYSNTGEFITDSLKYRRINSFRDGLAAVCDDYNKHKWGVIDSQGKLIIPCEYDRISSFHCGLAFVSKGVYCGYIDQNNCIKIPIKYKAASMFFSDNISYVSMNGWKGQLIDTEGNIVFYLEKEITLMNIISYVDLCLGGFC